jgi:ATP-dependent RNA helicase SUPV3L1/SUV3
MALAVSIGLEADNARRLLGSAGFRCDRARALPEGAHGAPAPDRWHWRPRRPGEERPERRGERRPDRNAERPAQDKRPPRGKPRDEKRDDRRGERPRGNQRGKPRHEPRPVAKPDTGPARAGGAFDKLADLLKG